MGTLLRNWGLFALTSLAACGGDDGGARTDSMSPMAGTGNGAVAGTAVAQAGTGPSGIAGTISSPGRAGSAAAPSGGAGTPAPSPAGTGPVAMAGRGAPPPTAGMPPAPAAGSGGTTPPPPPPGPPGTWPAADPAKTGPFATVTENNVGPGMAFTMFRPKDLTQRHPVITWGNGTGTTPPTYRSLLNLYASHGFIVIASNSMNVGQGTPPPMLDGVTWVLAQDMTEGSALYQHVDRERIGATGHSQGAFATSRAGTDPRIKTIAPIQVLGGGRFHGPVLALCGTMDTTLPCSGNLRAYMGVTDQPAMYGELKSATHSNWIFSSAAMPNPFHVITNAWFRVHLMNDTALRPMFYGECSVCKDTANWVTMRSKMDQ
jgi:hypothetical protein